MSAPSRPRRPLIAGNWKMNGLKAALAEAAAIAAGLRGLPAAAGADVMICPPTTLVSPLADALVQTGVTVGAQDCHPRASGAHTGDVSAEMVKDAGGGAVIVGHSERRADHGESDSLIRAKALAAHRAGLMAIVCVGESLGERRAGLTLAVVDRQLRAALPDTAAAATTVVAYEPVWAIGTGMTPTLEEVAEVHSAIRRALVARFGGEGEGMRILYGGSVKPDNARELLAVAEVDGALVGGASLKAADFLAIVGALPV